MALFKIVTRGGRREFEQVATEDELAKRKPPEPQPVVPKPPPKQPAAEPPVAAETKGPPAFLALLENLYVKPSRWVLQHIGQLSTHDEVAQLRRMEVDHPKYAGGRVGVLNALDAREADLVPQKFEEPSRVLSDEEREALVMSNEDFEV